MYGGVRWALRDDARRCCVSGQSDLASAAARSIFLTYKCTQPPPTIGGRSDARKPRPAASASGPPRHRAAMPESRGLRLRTMRLRVTATQHQEPATAAEHDLPAACSHQNNAHTGNLTSTCQIGTPKRTRAAGTPIAQNGYLQDRRS